MIESIRLHVPRSNQGNELHHAFILLPTSTLHSTARTFHCMHRGTVRPSQALHSRTLNRFAVADGEVKSDQSCHKCQQHLESYLSFGADGSWKIFWMWAFGMSHFMQSISFNWDYNSTQEDEKHLLKGAWSRFLVNSSSGHEKWLWKSSGTGWHCTSSFLDEQSWPGETKFGSILLSPLDSWKIMDHPCLPFWVWHCSHVCDLVVVLIVEMLQRRRDQQHFIIIKPVHCQLFWPSYGVAFLWNNQNTSLFNIDHYTRQQFHRSKHLRARKTWVSSSTVTFTMQAPPTGSKVSRLLRPVFDHPDCCSGMKVACPGPTWWPGSIQKQEVKTHKIVR